jgi:hypothetical protein
MYRREVLMSLETPAKLFRTYFFPFHESDIRLNRMTVYSMEKRRHHCQATGFWSDLDDVNYSVTVVNCFFSFWVSPEEYRGDLGKMITQLYTVTILYPEFIVSRTKSRPIQLL